MFASPASAPDPEADNAGSRKSAEPARTRKGGEIVVAKLIGEGGSFLVTDVAAAMRASFPTLPHVSFTPTMLGCWASSISRSESRSVPEAAPG